MVAAKSPKNQVKYRVISGQSCGPLGYSSEQITKRSLANFYLLIIEPNPCLRNHSWQALVINKMSRPLTNFYLLA